MRTTVLLSLVILCFFSCKEVHKNENSGLAPLEEEQHGSRSFGKQISAENSLTAQEMKLKYEGMKIGDTIPVKFTSSVKSVCKMKGCWMTLDLPDSEEDPMIKFKDYGFFMPKDIEGKEVVVEGVAFIEETSVEDRKHFAEDAGKGAEEIEAIKQPKKSPGFLAHGVLLKE